MYGEVGEWAGGGAVTWDMLSVGYNVGYRFAHNPRVSYEISVSGQYLFDGVIDRFTTELEIVQYYIGAGVVIHF